MINILILTNDEDTENTLNDLLRIENFNFLILNTEKEAVDYIDNKYEMIDLFIMDFSGTTDITNILKEKSSIIPVMVFTERVENTDKLYNYETGADDYVIKPINPVLIVPRIKTLLKNSFEKQLNYKRNLYGIVIDEAGHTVHINDVLLDLSPKEYELLLYLSNNYGAVISREQLINNVWGVDYSGDLRTLDTHIKNLRAKLGEKGEYIKTVHGLGYKFDK